MTTAFETEAKNVGEGDTVIAPSGQKLLVRKSVPCLGGMLELQCLNIDGKRIALTLGEDTKIKVVDA